MKRNDTDLTIPQRQSGWAIIFILLKFFRSFIRQAWVLLIPLVLGRNRSNSQWDIWEVAIAGLGLFSAVWSIIAYFRYYYSLSEEELIIQKGIINKSKINIPYKRIQSVNFKQNFLHQFLNVTEVAIDTAGSGEKEIEIDALTLENAKALRQEILDRKKVETKESNAEIEAYESIENIMSLSNSDLLKVGLTQNHLKPVGLIIGFVFSIWAYSWQFEYEINPMDVFKNIHSFVENLSFAQSIVLVFLFIIFSIAYSVITTFLNHANLLFTRISEKFQLSQGLFTRKEIAAIDRKIQFISWGQNLLQKKIGFFNLRFEQAGSRSFRDRLSNFRIPGCTTDKINFVKEAWMKENKIIHQTEVVSAHMFYYILRYLVIIFAIPLAALAYIGHYILFVLLFSLAIFSIVNNWLKYKKKRFFLDKDLLYITGGGLGFKYSLMPTYKVQNVSIEQNPYQWRRKLASLHIFTAAGALVIPFIPEKRAIELLDFFIYTVEKSKKPWM